MAFRRTLASRIFQQLAHRPHASLPADRPDLRKPLAAHRGILLQQRRISQSAGPFAGAPPRLPFPVEDDLIERIHSSIWGGDPIKFPPRSEKAAGHPRFSSVQEAAMKFLGQSGGVVIFLRPDQVVPTTDEDEEVEEEEDLRRRELSKMEAEKAAIDGKAEAQVRKELWAGLSLVLFQTLGFMRLTFWELSWDVMEPICFFTGSIYFMMAYAFFMRTAKEPSFEGFFASRFASKQKRLMQAHGFDLSRFNSLKKAHEVDLPRLKALRKAHGLDLCCHCGRDHLRSLLLK